MAKFNATDLIITIDGYPIAHATDGSLSLDHDLPDASSKSSAGWAEHISGQRSWSISTDSLIDYTATYGIEGAFDAINNRATVTAVFATETSGDLSFTGTCSVSSLSQNAPLEDVASMSIELTGTGALTKATV